MNIIRTLLASIVLVTPVFAQKLVVIKADVQSEVTVKYTDGNNPEVTRIKADSSGDGVVEITVPEGVTTVRISKYSDGEYITYNQRV